MHLLFFDFGTGEILLIVLAIFLVFGPGKIPELARTMGKFVNEIKKASEDVRSEINREADRQEREEKLKKYKEQVNSELDNEKGTTDSDQEMTVEVENETKDEVKKEDDPSDSKAKENKTEETKKTDSTPEAHEEVTNKPGPGAEKK